ncbi:hypothetical protein [Chondromyces crocatus]|uniref:Lipoprotein n=1 Tax=Chondromyces crocatus TaxID=52 RepID=A0A0K1E806_CHOCO|nr:hypothetical protein [Chondromyces crocatus]AKT36698.1 uncharacterized protein CMC5_008190 [Chondromyces crocatus]
MSQVRALGFAFLVTMPGALGCGPAPYLEAEPPPQVTARPAERQAVVVVLQEPAPEPAVEGWIPDAPREGNPLGQVKAWQGDYDCPQGTTELTLHILSVRGQHVSALFDFHHLDSGAAGRYLMAGRVHPETGRVMLTPGAWISQPRHYVSVGMSGELSEDGSLFAGRMEHPLCGAFRLRPAR